MLGERINSCRDCIFIPVEYWDGNGRYPDIDAAFSAGRESWTFLTGDYLSMGGMHIPLSADFILCDQHLAEAQRAMDEK